MDPMTIMAVGSMASGLLGGPTKKQKKFDANQQKDLNIIEHVQGKVYAGQEKQMKIDSELLNHKVVNPLSGMDKKHNEMQAQHSNYMSGKMTNTQQSINDAKLDVMSREKPKGGLSNILNGMFNATPIGKVVNTLTGKTKKQTKAWKEKITREAKDETKRKAYYEKQTKK